MRLPVAQEELILEVASTAKKTVVLLEGGSAIEVSPWLEQVEGLMMIWYPGCEGGHAVASVLFGETCPSGRLPVSFPRSIGQLMDWDTTALDVTHDLFHGYRYLDREGETPAFPFGFGLSYTTFSLDGLQVERAEDRFVFSVTVTNTGEREAAAVPQLYVSYDASKVIRAVRELKGFGRIELAPGEMADLQMEVTDEDLKYFDPDDGWTLEEAARYVSIIKKNMKSGTGPQSFKEIKEAAQEEREFMVAVVEGLSDIDAGRHVDMAEARRRFGFG